MCLNIHFNAVCSSLFNIGGNGGGMEAADSGRISNQATRVLMRV